MTDLNPTVDPDAEVPLYIPTDALALFDPPVLAHRSDDDPFWFFDGVDLEEIERGDMALVTLEDVPLALWRFTTGALTDDEASYAELIAGPMQVRSESGRLFFGHVGCLPGGLFEEGVQTPSCGVWIEASKGTSVANIYRVHGHLNPDWYGDDDALPPDFVVVIEQGATCSPMENIAVIDPIVPTPDDGEGCNITFAFPDRPRKVGPVPEMKLVTFTTDEGLVRVGPGRYAPTAEASLPAVGTFVHLTVKAVNHQTGKMTVTVDEEASAEAALIHENSNIRGYAYEEAVVSPSWAEPHLAALLAGLTDDVDSNYESAIDALAAAGDAAIEPLADLLSDDDAWEVPVFAAVRAVVGAARVLERIAEESPLALEALEVLLSHELADVRSIAAGAVGRIGGRVDRALRVLLPLITSGEEELEAPLAAIASLGKAAESAVPILEALLDEAEDIDDAEALAETLYAVTGDPAALVDILVTLVSDSDPETRHDAAHALADLGPAAVAAKPSLQGLLQDEDPHVREVAERALAAIG